jgi:hypothetical protein
MVTLKHRQYVRFGLLLGALAPQLGGAEVDRACTTLVGTGQLAVRLLVPRGHHIRRLRHLLHT